MTLANYFPDSAGAPGLLGGRAVSDLYRSARSHEELTETSDAGFFFFSGGRIPRAAFRRKVSQSSEICSCQRKRDKEEKSEDSRPRPSVSGVAGVGGTGRSQVSVKSCHISSLPRLRRMSFLLHCRLCTHTHAPTPTAAFSVCLFVCVTEAERG